VDVRRRELERAAAAGDSRAAEALIHARLRSGELSQQHLQVAAFLEDPLARELLGDDAPAPINHANLQWDIRRLKEFGDEACARAAIAAGRAVLPAWDAYRPDDPLLEYHLGLCQDLIDCWCDTHRSAFNANLLPHYWELTNREEPGGWKAQKAVETVSHARRMVDSRGSFNSPVVAFRHAVDTFIHDMTFQERTGPPRERVRAEVWATIRAALLAWIYDPLPTNPVLPD
jgi:hypothetical protein